MQNNNFAATLASVASEFGVEDTAKHGRGIKPSKRPYFRWTDEQLEQLATLHDEGKSANEIAEALGVSRDKVITKLAAMAARQRAGSKTPEQSTEPVPEAEAEPEQEAETEPSVEAEPEPELNPVSQDLNPTDVDIDRMIFTAFDAVVGRVDDFNKNGCLLAQGFVGHRAGNPQAVVHHRAAPRRRCVGLRDRGCYRLRRSMRMKNAAVRTAIPISGKEMYSTT